MSDFGEEYTHVSLQCDSTSARSLSFNFKFLHKHKTPTCTNELVISKGLVPMDRI
jgi:hypothetical protein